MRGSCILPMRRCIGYRWNADAKKAEILTDKVTTPMAAGFAGDGSLLALDYSRSVVAVDTKTGEATKIEPADAPLSGTNLLLPVGLHNSMETLVCRWSIAE